MVLRAGDGEATTTPALANYAKVPYSKRLLRVQEAIFLKTWASPTGEATTSDPLVSRRRSQLWTRLVPLKSLDEVLLVRNAGLTALGSLTPATGALVANLKITHHVGA
jgi:hypothetical protein